MYTHRHILTSGATKSSATLIQLQTFRTCKIFNPSVNKHIVMKLFFFFTATKYSYTYLVRGPSRDKDGIPYTLCNGPALHTILLVEPLPKVIVQVEQLVVNWVSARHWPKTSLLINLTKGKRSKMFKDRSQKEYTLLYMHHSVRALACIT